MGKGETYVSPLFKRITLNVSIHNWKYPKDIVNIP